MDAIKKPIKFNFWYLAGAVMLILIFQDIWTVKTQVKSVPYSDFQQLLKDKKISEVVLTEDGMTGVLATPDAKITTVHANRIDLETAKELDSYGVKFSKQTENTLLQTVLSWTLPILLFFFVWSFMAQRFIGKGGIQGGLMSVGKSKAKIYVETDIKTTFNDVAGAEEAQAELKEIVDFLKDPKKFERLGGRMPKGVLLVGPPGTGKTLIAKAVAGEAGVPFFSTNGAEFVEMFVGIGAARVRDLFEQAKEKAPCIIFIDELDALGKIRLVGGNQGNDEKEQTLNQLLVELDGFDSRSGIILLAATNRPEILDPALLRSGRFDRHVLVDRPDKLGRTAILKLHVRKTKLDNRVDLDKIAALTPGFTGADLANLVNEASLAAVRRNAEAVSDGDFTIAIERMLAGLEKRNRLINKFERNVVAHHEMGHAIISSAICPGETIHKISIIPRGVGALGYTLQRPTEDRFLMTKDELEQKMTVLMAGRAAEKIIFHHLSTGAADDLDRATDIAWAVVTRYGMADKLGDVVYEKSVNSMLGEFAYQPKTRNYSDETAHDIDCAVRNLIETAFHRAIQILSGNAGLLRESAKVLLEKETLTEVDLKMLLKDIKIPQERPRELVV